MNIIGRGHVRCAFKRGGLTAALRAAKGNSQLERYAEQLERERSVLAVRPYVTISRDGFVMSFGASRFVTTEVAQFI